MVGIPAWWAWSVRFCWEVWPAVVAVVGGDEVVGSGFDDALQVVLGEGGSAGGDDVGEPGPVGGDGVGVSLDRFRLLRVLRDAVCGFVDAVEGVGLVVEGGGAGV